MPNWTDPPDWSGITSLDSATLNAIISDNLDHLHDWLGELAVPAEGAADTATFTAETTILTLGVTVPVGGRNAALMAKLSLQSSVAGDEITVRIKEGGTVLDEVTITCSSANKDVPARLRAHLVAPASGAHTYILTALRASGSGVIKAKGSAANPQRLECVAL